jgi:23S rRNA (cytidine1920-2'-O)/16S rRNA (cytidine1409-2'-O)-methyltransferase
VPSRPRFVALAERLRDFDNPAELVAAHRVRVGGTIVTNPRARVPRDAPVVVTPPMLPRGTVKLAAALGAFAVRVSGRVCLDVGASTGGFTRALLDAGARCVYAVDAGYGQLLGSLRADSRVVNLERTNLGILVRRCIPAVIDVVTIDVSYLGLADAAPQLEVVAMAPDADLVALVKPMYELHRDRPPTDPSLLAQSVELAAAAFSRAGWRSPRHVTSPVEGRRGAVELLLHMRRGGAAG